MSGIFRRYLSLGFVALLCLCLSGCSALTSLYFYPQSVWIRTPEALGLEYQDVWLTAADGTQLHAWWLPPQGEAPARDQVVLYLHGNAENISSHIRNIDWLPVKGIGVLALDYRGFGASQGEAFMPAVLQDVEAAAHWLRAHYQNQQLVVLGQSMGAALAVNFVAEAGERYQVQALILDAPFSGFPQVARAALTSSWLGWLFVPLTWMIPARWNPQDKAADIAIPTLVMHSPQDRVIPYAQGHRVFQQLGDKACWFDSQGPHIASFSFKKMRRISQLFIQTQDCRQLNNAAALSDAGAG